MESNPAQYPYLPLPSQEPLLSYTPYTPIRDPIQEYQPAKYPTFDQPQPQPQYVQPAYIENELKFQHLNAVCPLHLHPLDTVCRAPDCARRLLCRQCADDHRNHFAGHEETFGSLQELLDDTVTVELDALVREEQITIEIAERNSYQRMNSPLENFKMQMSEMMGRVQKEAGKMGDWFTEKQNMFGMEWDNLRREYLEKKRRFLQSRPGCQTVELAQLVEVVNKIKEKQCKMEKKVQEAWKKQASKIDKFVMKWQEKSRKFQEKGAKKIDKKMKKVEKFWRELGF